ncbi:MAG: type IV pilus secretin PilQ [Terriglobia bacterium]
MKGKLTPALLLIASFLLAAVFAPVGQRAATTRLAALRSVAVPSARPANEVLLRIEGSYSYHLVAGANHEALIDLSNVRMDLPAENAVEWSGLATGYHVAPFQGPEDSQPVKMAASLREPEPDSIHRDAAGLRLGFGGSPFGQAVAAQAAIVPVSLPVATGVVASPDVSVVAPGRMAQVTHVSILPSEDGGTIVDVGTTGPVEFKPFRLKNPVRLVVDLQKTATAHAQEVTAPSAGVLKDIRVSQFSVQPSMVTRVVADLSENTPSSVEAEPHGVRIQFQGKAPDGKAGHAASAAQTVPAQAAARERLEARQMKTPVILRPLKTVAPARELVDLSRPVKVDWDAMKPAGAAAAPAQEPKRSTQSEAVKPPEPAVWNPRSGAAVAEAGSLPPQVQEALHAAQIVAGASQTPQQPLESTILSTPSVQQAAPVYTGKLISLDLKDVDIRDFFRLVHQVSGLNIVVDSGISGRVTLVLDDVPWDQALDLVLKNNDLGKVFEGNVLRIAKVQTLTAEADSQTTLRAAKLQSEPLVTIFRRLKYAHASDQKPSMSSGGMGGAGGGGGGGGMGGSMTSIPGIATILKGFQKGTVLSDRGSIVEDPRDNAIIITDVPSQIPVIESVINKLDTKAKQVSIQVRVILANANFSRTLSTVLGTAFRNGSGTTSTAAGTGSGITGTASLPSPLPPLSAVTQPGSVSASGFGAFAISNAGARYAINAAISAAEEHDQARTISRPTIVTQDNVLGEVQQGVQVPIQTDINNTIAVQYVNATLMLSVTPQVTVDNKVFLNIYVNNASIGSFSTLSGPSINTQEATTQVLVPDGGTVVFGGITVTTRGRSANYIPLLGSIPVIGNLFKSSQVNDQNQELLFFVTPIVLPG